MMREAKGIEDRHIIERPPIVLTASDRDRLSLLLLTSFGDGRPEANCFLREELQRADIVGCEVSPRAMVSIGSTVKFVDHEAARIKVVKLVYPSEANDVDLISVTGTLGSALIGLGPGQTIGWHEDHRERRITVLETFKIVNPTVLMG